MPWCSLDSFRGSLQNRAVKITLTNRLFLLGMLAGLALSILTGCAGVSSGGKTTTQQTTGGSQLTVSPTTMSFGSVAVGKNSSQTGALSASGSDVTVSSAAWNGEGYAVSGISFPVTIPAGQKASFTVTFTPQASGSSPGSITFDSNAADSSIAETLSGTGAQQNTSSHTVGLSWNASASQVVGYNIYRGTTSGGPYTRLNPSLLSATNYTDSSVDSGTTYYYVATAMDSSNVESQYSNQASAAIPAQ